MDGFAVLHADTVKAPAKLTIVGVSNAGTQEQPRIEKGEALRIMTGGPMPSGADSIIPIELYLKVMKLFYMNPRNLIMFGKEVKILLSSKNYSHLEPSCHRRKYLFVLLPGFQKL